MSATIDKIQFNSHITLDFAHFEQLYQDKNQDIFVEKYKPVASNYTRSLVCFEPNGDYDSKGMTQEALGYQFDIYRNEIGDSKLVPIYKTSVGQLSIVDYNVRNQKEYQYYVFKENEESSSKASLSNTVQTCWWDYAIIGMTLDDEDSKTYKVNPSDVWLFQSNVSSDSTTQNFSKTTYQTLMPYPTVSMGKSNYATGSFSGLIGRVRKKRYDEDATLLEQWNDFCANPQLKLYKDRKGHKYIVDITSSSSDIADETREQATTVSVGWTQIGNADDYVIIGD